ncbi:MAG: phage tail tape measure protein, partial [Siculibacillus sp.]|nr:phage tail tape measure protein [Siculibacillus sp.]
MSDSTELGEVAGVAEGLAATFADLSGLSTTFGRSLTTALKGAIVQGKGLDAVLRGLAERLASKMLDRALSPLAGGLTSLVGGLFGFADGGVVAAGRVRPFAAGGMV